MEFTKEQVEKMAKEYAEEQNDCYTNDYYGFIAGFEKALSLFVVSGRSEQLSCSTCKHLNRENDGYCDGCFKFALHEKAT